MGSEKEGLKLCIGWAEISDFSFCKTVPGVVNASDHWLLLSEFRFHASNA